MEYNSILVTGATGYLGSYIVKEFLSINKKVKAVFRDENKKNFLQNILAKKLGEECINTNLKWVKADLKLSENWNYAFEDIDVLVHAAAPLNLKSKVNEEQYLNLSKRSIKNLLNLSLNSKVKKIILVSSAVTIYTGNPNGNYSEKDVCKIKNKYISSYFKYKYITEQYFNEFVKKNNFNYSIIHPGLILGPMMTKYNLSTNELILKMINARFMPFIKYGWNCVDVRDVAKLICKCTQRKESNNKNYIAAGKFYWLEDIYKIVESKKISKRRVVKLSVNTFIFKILCMVTSKYRRFYENLGKKRNLISKKALIDFNWNTRNLDDTIDDCIKSLKKNKYI